MEQKKIGVVGGNGYVGKAMVNFFEDHYSVKIYDPSLSVDGKEAVNECDLAVVCVPTAMGEDGVVDTSIVEESIKWLETPVILIKSTIPPGTTEMLKGKYGKRIVFSPEYIGEGKYEVKFWKGHPHPTNMKMHDFQIFGGDREDTKYVLDLFTPVLGPSVTYAQTDSKTAEFVKYFENVWGAMKVSFFNEMFECANAVGVDYREARELWALDGRVEKMHSVVFPEKRGWAGKCYPKDLVGFIKHIQKAGYEPEMLKEVVKTNSRFSQIQEMKDLKNKL